MKFVLTGSVQNPGLALINESPQNNLTFCFKGNIVSLDHIVIIEYLFLPTNQFYLQ